ncbi:MAG: LLM class flavin-dependent oxidoreductase [Candidatus Gastranaerophilaceae bacterium]
MDNNIKLDIDNLASQLKYLAAIEGLTMTSVKLKVNKKYNKTDSNRNLSNKLRNKTFRVSELAEIADILDYEIYLHKKIK